MRTPAFASASLAALFLSSAAALGQEPPRPREPRPVPPPRVLGGERLPPIGPRQRPPLGETDDPSAALVIDGVKIDRATYGEALIGEYGQSYIEPFVANFLVERRAKELGIAIGPAEIEAAVEKQANDLLEKRYRGKEEMLKAALEQNGLTIESWKEGIRRRSKRELLLQAVVKADRDLSEPALRKEFEARYGPGGERRRGRSIFFSTQVWNSNLYTQDDYQKEKAAIESEAKARAEQALAEIRAGADFAMIAKTRSDDPMAEKGGDYGRYWQNRFGPDADKRIDSLKPGEVSEPIETPRGFIIARCTGISEGWEFKARHILLSTRLEGQPSAELKANKLAEAKAEARKIIERLKAGEDFAKIARERSDDPGTKGNGGDLGTFGTGRMVAPFEQALLGLKDGEISEPVETTFGVHVIQLISKTRKEEDDKKLVSVILFSTEFLKVKERKLKDTLEAKAKAAAEECAAKIKAGESAEKLAKERSEDPIAKEKGGLVEEPLPPALGADFATAFRALASPGDLTVLKTERGYYVIALESIEKHTFEAEKDALAAELRSKEPAPAEIRAYREKLRAAATVLKGKM
jgi:peptidyl-prolyl cis-trans isomerase SurA